MPQNFEFWNPYRVISSSSEVIRKKPFYHHKLYEDTCNGSLNAELVTLTPIVIGGRRIAKSIEFIKTRKTGKPLPFIPGTSLKGMCRSFAELIGGGCFSVTKRGEEKYKCSAADSLCITCRMFGMMGGKKGVFLGKVSFGDGELIEKNPLNVNHKILLSSPKDNHKAFYDSYNMRKLYHHNPRCIEKPQVTSLTNDSVSELKDLCPAGSRFAFTIHFTNLSEEELNLLIYVLILENNLTRELVLNPGKDNATKYILTGSMAHKIGLGKPIGMGSAQINITRLQLFKGKERYLSYTSSDKTVFEGDSLNKIAAQLISRFTERKDLTMESIRKMMIFDPNDPREFRYPGKDWFNSNSSTGLKKL